MGKELDRLFSWLRDHPQWTATVIHTPEGNAFRLEIRLSRGKQIVGQMDRYYREDARLMKATVWTMVDEVIDAAMDADAKEVTP